MQKPTLLSAMTIIFGLLPSIAAAPVSAQDTAADDQEYTLSRAGDAKNGERVFGRCRACHGLRNSRSKAGPSLHKIFGRPAGTVPEYGSYSKALRESGILWSERSLDEWLASPVDFLPGNKMNLAPIRNAQDRMDLIAYLRKATK